MDHKTMYQYVYDMLEQSLETYTDEELETEVKDYYPHLIGTQHQRTGSNSR